MSLATCRCSKTVKKVGAEFCSLSCFAKARETAAADRRRRLAAFVLSRRYGATWAQILDAMPSDYEGKNERIRWRDLKALPPGIARVSPGPHDPVIYIRSEWVERIKEAA